MQKCVGLTGGDGLLGSNVIRELLQRGYRVRVFRQPERASLTLAGLAIEEVYGDILRPDTLSTAFQGCDYVIHAAASTRIWPSRDPASRRVNIEGTRNVLNAARDAGVERLIYVGTANTYGAGSKADPGSEARPYAGAVYGLDYMDSKREAQELVMQYVADGLPALVVNPTFMIGPYDATPSSGALIRSIAMGLVPGYTRGGRNYIAVKDAAVGIANALTMGRVGQGYILGHENMSYKEAFTRIASVLGVRPPRHYIPSGLVLVGGLLGSMTGTLLGRAPKVSWAMARIACDEHYYTPRKAVDELSLPQSSLDDAIRECYDWLHKHNYLA